MPFGHDMGNAIRPATVGDTGGGLIKYTVLIKYTGVIKYTVRKPILSV